MKHMISNDLKDKYKLSLSDQKLSLDIKAMDGKVLYLKGNLED